MTRLLWIFSFVFLFGYLFTESWAVEPPPINEMDALLKNIKSHTQAVGQATKEAHQVSEKLVEEKVQEKAELKEAVVVAEAKVEKMEEKIEVYAVKMIGSGIDTAVEEVQFKGLIYDAWLNYLEEGGKEDFNWFRLYIWQQN